MSKIDELLNNEKVEWKKLGEVCECFAGGTPNTSIASYYDGDIPWLRSGEINFNIITRTDRNITEEGLKNSSAKKIRKNSIVLAMTGATVGRSAVVEIETTSNQSVAAIENDEKILNYKFLYYYIANKYNYIRSLGQGALTSLNLSIIKNLEIPIPSIKTQEKIVKILDKFTNYVTELQAELQARTKQYEYYRDMLLSEDYLNKLSEKLEGGGNREFAVEYKKLGEIGEIQMCKRILKNQTSLRGDIPFYKIGTFGKVADSFITRELFNEYKEKYCYPKKGEILISASGTIGRTVIFDGEDAYFQDSNIVWISHNEEVALNKYLYYLYQIINWRPSTGGTINRLYNYNLKNIKVFLPPIEIQNKVVQILDKFQSLLADTKGLLPQEIEQRQKQYEYYREKLLTLNVEHDSTHARTHAL